MNALPRSTPLRSTFISDGSMLTRSAATTRRSNDHRTAIHVLELPEELLQLIFGHLPTEALINTHLSSRALHSLTSKLVLQRKIKHYFFTCLGLTDLPLKKGQWSDPIQILYNIEKEPVVALHIKSIIWDSTYDYFVPDYRTCSPPYWPAGCKPRPFTTEARLNLIKTLNGGSDHVKRMTLVWRKSQPIFHAP